MKEKLDEFPQVVDYAMEAVTRAGVTPIRTSIKRRNRWFQTVIYGASLPEYIPGEHHSKQEWVSIQDMEKAVDTIVHLAVIWEEKS